MINSDRHKSEERLVAFVDVNQVNFFDLMVVMMMEMNFIDDCKMVMISQMSGFDVYPIDPFMLANSVDPSLFNVRMLKFCSQRVMFDVFCDSSIVVVEGCIDNYNFVSHFKVN